MRSPAMGELRRKLAAVAAKDVALMFVGESGAGKEVLARCAHALSARRRGPFVAINCTAIPEALFESEFFGHERGAFTGATARASGKIESASGGTLFLDEIGDMPLAMQGKLLRFLENRKFMRVGGVTKINADVRLMFATLRPIEQDVANGRFRADLYYRVQGMTLRVPPLRERRADLAVLIRHAFADFSALHEVPPPRLSRVAKAILLRYDWPGNVRELRTLVESLCLLRSGRPVRAGDLPERLRGSAPEVASSAPSPRCTVDLNDGLASISRQLVEQALVLDQGNVARAAERLRLSPRTIQRYLAHGHVHRPRGRVAS